jgi:hypothetical protein
VPYQRQTSSSAAIELRPNVEKNRQESIMAVTNKVIQGLKSICAITSRLIKGPDFAELMLMKRFTPYRPELHYMRGPGPKWHAKNDSRTASLDDVLADLRTPMHVAARPIIDS